MCGNCLSRCLSRSSLQRLSYQWPQIVKLECVWGQPYRVTLRSTIWCILISCTLLYVCFVSCVVLLTLEVFVASPYAVIYPKAIVREHYSWHCIAACGERVEHSLCVVIRSTEPWMNETHALPPHRHRHRPASCALCPIRYIIVKMRVRTKYNERR